MLGNMQAEARRTSGVHQYSLVRGFRDLARNRFKNKVESCPVQQHPKLTFDLNRERD